MMPATDYGSAILHYESLHGNKKEGTKHSVFCPLFIANFRTHTCSDQKQIE